MLQSKYKDPLINFVVHGVKEIGNYTYVLLVDLTAQALIQRVKSDNTEILFAKKPGTQTIADFWSDPTIPSYVYIYQL